MSTRVHMRTRSEKTIHFVYYILFYKVNILLEAFVAYWAFAAMSITLKRKGHFSLL